MSRRISGLHKSAVLLSSIGSEHAKRILRRLPDELTEQIGGQAAAIRDLPPEVRTEVLAEFCAEASGFHAIGLEANGLRLLPSPGAWQRESSYDADAARPFAALHEARADNLIDCLRGEHPQAIALILSHLPAARCAEVLASLPGEQRYEVIKRLVRIEQASADVIRQVEHSLEGRVRSIVERVSEAPSGGTVAEVLDRAARGGFDSPAPCGTGGWRSGAEEIRLELEKVTQGDGAGAARSDGID
jgi:flagellar motor switch protein FliG